MFLTSDRCGAFLSACGILTFGSIWLPVAIFRAVESAFAQHLMSLRHSAKDNTISIYDQGRPTRSTSWWRYAVTKEMQ